MPIYAFECAACGHSFDRLQRMSDPDPTVCPECGAEQVRRQLTAPQFRLSGGGWYETDFKKDGDKKRNLTGKDESAGKTESKSEAKSESKPESKPTPPAKSSE
ncbi:FmdB family zinc ribbon protein [Arenimonas sp.]|uniref:FmdB family zinc ribbon protein n=1 Tax=Arenimonas sp. TaxID=1872635 RepID=UPI0039E55095